ncbi:MAG: RagB/SusD family nutrient uptake outer membrane protein [Ginsengibacter sp.]
MKKNYIIYGSIVIAFVAIVISCKRNLEIPPSGVLSNSVLATKSGVDGLLIGAYSLLRGYNPAVPNDGVRQWTQAASNWIYGSVVADEAHKGSVSYDQPEIASMLSYNTTAVNTYLNDKWVSLYAGVQRANDVLRILPLVKDGSLTPDQSQQVGAEARFLRGFFLLEAAKIFRNVPFIDETINYSAGNGNVTNTEPIWPKIEADFQAAISVLPNVQAEPGRVNLWAAKAFLAKTYMFEHKFTEANILLKDIIANGVTSSGMKYNLEHYADNFNPSTKNGSESVFAVQFTVHDGGNGLNGNSGDILNFPAGGPATCCGFFQPSFSFVNAFKTDPVTGLPLFDSYNTTDLKNDQGLTSSDPFTPTTDPVDSRLDWTVGRRGIPYLDWGIHPGKSWITTQDEGGPYSPIKNVYYNAEKATTSDNGGGWAPGQASSNNYNVIRFSDVLLWAAECEVEIGSLSQAEIYVNMVRARAADPTGWVHTYIDNNDPTKGFTNIPAANYKVGLYTGQFSAKGQDYAREAVRFERRLELGMEGHRFFDLQRYDNGTGYMEKVLDSYIQHELNVPKFNPVIYKGATFKKGKNEIYPIPQIQIDLSVVGNSPVLKQNANY